MTVLKNTETALPPDALEILAAREKLKTRLDKLQDGIDGYNTILKTMMINLDKSEPYDAAYLFGEKAVTWGMAHRETLSVPLVRENHPEIYRKIARDCLKVTDYRVFEVVYKGANKRLAVMRKES